MINKMLNDGISKVAIAQGTFFLLLTPMYLWMVYYKTVYDTDLGGLLVLSTILLIVYFPFQVILSQNKQELSIHSLLDNEDARRYLNILFTSVGIFVAGGVLSVFFTHMKGNIFFLIIGFSIYASWLYLSHNIFLIWMKSDLANFVKIAAMLLLIIGLFIASSILDIREEFGFSYIIAFISVFVQAIFTLILIMPSIAISVFRLVFNSKPSSDSSNNSNVTLMPLLFTPGGLFMFFMFFMFFMDWFSNYINSFNSHTVALLLTVSMIGISSLGTYFQLRVFAGTFFYTHIKKISLVLLALFYGIMIINMNIVNTIDNTSKKIQIIQANVSNFNKTVQPK
ncbi:hypothetical protein [Candidatus Sulfurimonas baltica]|uniref:Uncharacterized protein n=1 Tax=Candidatus Sulfurimonas baltica TaxID=2740404 RepID=A0A7S7LYI2_9BACT|nr:hypothetical protein [Candidatus Sulfurimonas baltica]QOY53208.1 hypothetical protein HUE88_05885 [Candidatus Sulfurimonas baltica]